MSKSDKLAVVEPTAEVDPHFSASIADEVVKPESYELVIEPRHGWISIDVKELLFYRELLFSLISRDINIRYKQTVLGVAWAVLQPVMTMIIFTFIFGRFAKMPSEGVPYSLFVFAGLMPWTFFSNGVNQASQSLISQQQLLSKIYFPRLFVPTSSIGGFSVDLLISFGILLFMMVILGAPFNWGIVFVPFLIALLIVAALGLGYALSALTVLYRDFRYIVPFMLQIMMYLSPVIFPISMFPARYQLFLALNPVCGIIEAIRSSLLGTPWKLSLLAVSTTTSLIIFVFGLYYFRKSERYFADIA